MTFVVDGHDENMILIKIFFPQQSLDLRLTLLKSCSGEVGVENSIGRILISNESLLHHLDVYVDHIVIEPLAKMQPAKRFIGKFLYTVETGCFYLVVPFWPIFPVVFDPFEGVLGDDYVVWLLLAVFSIQVFLNFGLVLFFEFKLPPNTNISFVTPDGFTGKLVGILIIFLCDFFLRNTKFLHALIQLLNLIDDICVHFLLFFLFRGERREEASVENEFELHIDFLVRCV